MNNYKNIKAKQEELKINFLNSKTETEISAGSALCNKFNTKGLSKEEYEKLIKYFFNVNINVKHDFYKTAEVVSNGKNIPFYSLDQESLYIHDKVIKATFILN